MQCDRHNGGLTVLCNDIDISSYVDDISWQNTKDTLATLFNFSVPKAGDMKYINMYKPQEGDIIRYSGGTQEDFRGVIIEVDDGDNYVNKYVAGDVGQYLNKTFTLVFLSSMLVLCSTFPIYFIESFNSVFDDILNCGFTTISAQL